MAGIPTRDTAAGLIISSVREIVTLRLVLAAIWALLSFDADSRGWFPIKAVGGATLTRPNEPFGAKIGVDGKRFRTTCCCATTITGGAAGERRRDLRRTVPHLHGASSKTAVVGLPKKAFLFVAA
jgi:hypothetical protein